MKKITVNYANGSEIVSRTVFAKSLEQAIKMLGFNNVSVFIADRLATWSESNA